MVNKEEKISLAARIANLKEQAKERVKYLNDDLKRHAFYIALLDAEHLVRILTRLDEIDLFLSSNDIDLSEVGLCQQKKK
ncbi:hypothetical protein J7L13_03260 [bacterium]|nr:hypothetical protein [bacterium]